MNHFAVSGLCDKLIVSVLLLLLCGNSMAQVGTFDNEALLEIKAVTISDFDSGLIELYSFPLEDEDSLDWELNSAITYNQSPYSLKVYGNTWKVQDIDPVNVKIGDVWQVSAYIVSKAEIQGIGIQDADNVLFYSFSGTEEVDIDQWVTVYQGCFPENQWNIYQLPIADDWLAFFGYLPNISSLVYINDKDDSSQGVFYLDNIINITDDLACAPVVTVDYTLGKEYNNGDGNQVVDVQFLCEVTDPDSDEHNFVWRFGDDSTSILQNPTHTFLVSDDHAYNVFVQVVDQTDKRGWAQCSVSVESGNTSFPVTLNFVGDIMLARKYEQNGGIIPTQGVEAIFEAIKPFLGDAADITIANLECPLTTNWEHHPTKSVYFKGSPLNVQGLTYAGIDVVSLANNHTLDYMEEGMKETQQVLADNGIAFSGAGENTYEASMPLFYSKKGVTFAFLASCDRTGQYNNYQPYLNAGYNKPGFSNLTHYDVVKQIDEVRELADLVVMEWHSGVEYSSFPSNKLHMGISEKEELEAEINYSLRQKTPDAKGIAMRHFAIDNGADLVICHHPHIMQAVELYNGKLIAHSLGNFVFDLEYPESFPTLILNTEVDETGFYAFSITPVFIDDYIPQRAYGELGLHLLDDLANRSRDLNTYLYVDRDSVVATVIMDTTTMIRHNTSFSVEQDLSDENGVWKSEPFSIRHSGSISSVDIIQPEGLYDFRLGREEIWFGNMEDEGCSLWDLNNSNETFCDSVAWDGLRSLQHIRTADAPYNLVTELEKRMPCDAANTAYSLCGYMKTQNAKDVTIQIQYFADRTGSMMLAQEDVGVSISGTAPWTFYSHELSVPSAAEYYTIRLNSGVPDSGIAYSWFDNVSVVSWSNWDDYTIMQPIAAPNDYYFMQVKSPSQHESINITYSETTFNSLSVGVEPRQINASQASTLAQNFPNPFNPIFGPTNISFRLEKAASVRVEVYKLNGQKVASLTNKEYAAGLHTIYWNGKDVAGKVVAPGIYLYEMTTPGVNQVKKCMIMR